MLADGLAANLFFPLLFIACLAGVLRLWADPGDITGLLVGLGVVAAMPVAGSATAWSKKADGDTALSLGLVLGSTLLGPLTTPAVLFGVSLLLAGDDAAGRSCCWWCWCRRCWGWSPAGWPPGCRPAGRRPSSCSTPGCY